jgi:hypothetical protein
MRLSGWVFGGLALLLSNVVLAQAEVPRREVGVHYSFLFVQVVARYAVRSSARLPKAAKAQRLARSLAQVWAQDQYLFKRRRN